MKNANMLEDLLSHVFDDQHLMLSRNFTVANLDDCIFDSVYNNTMNIIRGAKPYLAQTKPAMAASYATNDTAHVITGGLVARKLTSEQGCLR